MSFAVFADAGTIGLHEHATVTSEYSWPGMTAHKFIKSCALAHYF